MVVLSVRRRGITVLRQARHERVLVPSLPASGKLRLSIGTVDNLSYRSQSCQIGFDTGGSDRCFWGCLMTKLIFAVSTAVLATMLAAARSEEHTSELQSLMRISYAVF